MTEELRRSYAELERFAHVCSHDLKEPLRTTASFVQLLMAHNSGIFDDTSKLYVQHILKSIHRMESLIKNILLYSKVSLTKDNHCEVDLAEVMATIQQDFAFRLQDADGSIRVDPLPSLQADPTQMYQLFTNLISNAIKFRSQEPLQIVISATERQKSWEFSVIDNGIGIEKEYQKNVFDMFTRLNSQSHFEGSGIGLSICQKIVEVHGGAITVESNPTGGCEFKVILPKE